MQECCVNFGVCFTRPASGARVLRTYDVPEDCLVLFRQGEFINQERFTSEEGCCYRCGGRDLGGVSGILIRLSDQATNT